MARPAMAGSILAGWAVEPGTYQPARCWAGGCWAVGHTDSGSGWPAARARWPPRGAWRSAIGGRRGPGEHQHVLVDDQVGGLAAGAGLAGLGELPERRPGTQLAVAHGG